MISNDEPRKKLGFNTLKASHTVNAPFGVKKMQERKIKYVETSPQLLDSATILQKTCQKPKHKRQDPNENPLHIIQRDVPLYAPTFISQREAPLNISQREIHATAQRDHNISQRDIPQHMVPNHVPMHPNAHNNQMFHVSTSQRQASQIQIKKPFLLPKNPLIKPQEKPLSHTAIRKKVDQPPSELINQEQQKKQPYLCYEKLVKTVEKPVVKKQTTPRRQVISDEPHQKIANFEREIGQLVMAGEIECMQFLSNRHSYYQIDSTYIEKKQKKMTWLLRAIVIDWMAQICYQYQLKRETYYLATIVFDNYFERTSNISQSEFQVVGAAAIFITAKLEEFDPLSSKKLSQATCHRYTAQDIKAAQRKICSVLKYFLNGPTTNMWANRVMLQWDLFVQQQKEPEVENFFAIHKAKLFKKFDIDAYRNYRQVMEILDTMTLEIQAVSHKPQVLVLALIYLVLGKEYGFFTLKNIVNKFPQASQYMEQDYEGFTNVFEFFLENLFSMELLDILPSVQFAATFFSLEITYYRPKLPDEVSIEAEDYSSYMTYNPNMLEVVKHRYRGL